MSFGHGPTRREEQIIAAHERGLATRQIAEQLDLSPKYVENVLGRLASPLGDSWQPSARQGSRQLLAALQRHHPERCL